MQSEPGLGHINFDGLVAVRELAVHQNLPLKRARNAEQKAKKMYFSKKKCKGAIEYERHCFSTSNHKHISAKDRMMYKH